MQTRSKLIIGALALVTLVPGASIIGSTDAAARHGGGSVAHRALARYERQHPGPATSATSAPTGHGRRPCAGGCPAPMGATSNIPFSTGGATAIRGALSSNHVSIIH
jgi:hypothetical protein